MPDNPTCPWCGAEATEWSLLVNRGEWLCGSHKSGKEPYQSVECKNNVLEAENARLQAVVDRLPKTVDGVPAPIWGTVYTIDGHPMCVNISASGYAISHCYSTRELAEAAKEAKP